MSKYAQTHHFIGYKQFPFRTRQFYLEDGDFFLNIQFLTQHSIVY